MAGKVNMWEELRKHARQLENEIDLKLVTFSKLGTGHISIQKVDSDTEPLLNEDVSFEATSSEIQQLLNKLSSVSDKLSEVSASTASPTTALLHTVQRHKEILKDYTQEFNKIQANYKTRKERDLLLGVRDDINNSKTLSGLNRRMDLNLKENEHIRNSNRLVDEQIAIAMETREHLNNQRIIFKKFQTRINDLSNHFPLMNSLMQRIHIRKRRDSLILGLVVGICTILLLMYAFH